MRRLTWLERRWLDIVWFFKTTTWYYNWKYETFVYNGTDEKFKKLLATVNTDQYFRIGWLILVTNKSRTKAWIHHDTRETNNG